MKTSEKRIMVVEDDHGLVSILRELLCDEGYDVLTHSCPTDAVRVIRAVQPDLVLLDLYLAGDRSESPSGWRILDNVIVDPGSRHIPVVVITAAVESVGARRAALLPRDAVRVLAKPFDIDSLLGVIVELLDSPRAAATLQQHAPLQALTPAQLR